MLHGAQNAVTREKWGISEEAGVHHLSLGNCRMYQSLPSGVLKPVHAGIMSTTHGVTSGAMRRHDVEP